MQDLQCGTWRRPGAVLAAKFSLLMSLKESVLMAELASPAVRPVNALGPSGPRQERVGVCILNLIHA
jgi:hypothetical protein